MEKSSGEKSRRKRMETHGLNIEIIPKAQALGYYYHYYYYCMYEHNECIGSGYSRVSVGTGEVVSGG